MEMNPVERSTTDIKTKTIFIMIVSIGDNLGVS